MRNLPRYIYSKWTLDIFMFSAHLVVLMYYELLLLTFFCWNLAFFIISLVQWKFAFLSLGRPEYLEDSDVVSGRFHVCISFFFYLPKVSDVACLLKPYWIDIWIIFPQRRDVYGAWDQYLGLEHSDNAPKRAYAANQVLLPFLLFQIINFWLS